MTASTFASKRASSDARAATGDAARGATGRGGDQRRGGGRVADAHLAHTHDVHAIACPLVLEQLDPRGHRLLRVDPRHRGALRDVVSPRGQAEAQQLRILDRVATDACVDDAHARFRVIREHVDGSATAQEVGDHLPRHLGGVGRDALRRHAVIRRRDDDQPLVEAWAIAAGDAGDADGERLELPE